MRRIVLTTERLVLRALAEQDAPSVQAMVSDFDVAGKLAVVPHPYPDGAALEFIQRSRSKVPDQDGFDFAITCDGDLIGIVSLHGQNHPNQSDGIPGIGYWLGKPYWGRGYMTEAANEVLTWIFATLAPEIIRSGAFAHNSDSINVLTKLGFRRTGQSMLYCTARDTVLPHVDMELRETFRQGVAA
ncbi:MAG: GNAT family N-acetyltransferase [Stappiaceae bacterium]